MAAWPGHRIDAQWRPLRAECKALSASDALACERDPALRPVRIPDPDVDPGAGPGGGPPLDRGCDSISGGPINANVRWDQVWQALNDRGGCTSSCHLGAAPAADLDFSSRSLGIYYLVGQQSTQGSVTRVVPGNAAASLLYQKIACAMPAVGLPMPPPAGRLPADVQALVYDWIEQGALGEASEDPIPRVFVFKDSLETVR